MFHSQARRVRARSMACNAWDLLETRALLTATPLSLSSVNYAGTNAAAIGALFPSISADGRYVAFESGSFQGSITPAPSDLVAGLTVQNDAPNVYLRDQATNTTICLSRDYQTGTTGNNDSRYPIISANGNTVVFLSNATDLTANDNSSNNPNSDQNVFVWTRATGTVSLVTVNYQGTGPANDPDPQYFGTAENIHVSADGRYVVYDSEATNLVPGITNNNYTANVYVRDLQTNTTILVSWNVAGINIGDAPSNDAVISADGSTIAFDSLANNLDPNHNGGAPNSNYQVYVSTLGTNDTVVSTSLASVDSTGTTVGNNTSIFPSLSDNGQMLAFQSASTNLVGTPNGGSYNDIYVRNMSTGVTQLVSIDVSGVATGNSSSFNPQMSGDGNHVLFSSLATDLTNTPVVSSKNVFERNLATSTTQLVSINAQGTSSGNNTSDLANLTTVNSSQEDTGQISDNGQFVVFKSVATDLVAGFLQESGGAPFGYDVYYRDTVAGTTTLLSHAVGSASTGGTGESVNTDLTPDGFNVAFQSAFPTNPDNLVSNDTFGQTQLFHANLAPLPNATTQAASAITTTTATLNATVNPEGNATTVSFVYGTSPTLASGTTTTPSQAIGNGTSDVSVNAAISGLQPTTTYYFEVVATYSGGTIDGSILSFTTASSPGSIQFSASAYQVNEHGGSVTITATRTGGSAGAVGIHYATITGGTALAGTVYTPISNTLAWANGDTTSKTFSITILNPPTAYGAETIDVGLDTPTGGATLGNPSAAVVTIIDSVPNDFLGTGQSQPAVYRPSTAAWYVQTPSGTTQTLTTFGWIGHDIPVPGDYDGVGHTEQVVFRPSTDQWFVLQSNGTTKPLPNFGWPGHDVPAPGDYDGVGHTEQAVYRPSTGQWFVLEPNGTTKVLGTFGWIGHDIPVPGDYDGVGHTQIAVYRPSTSQWFVLEPNGSTETLATFGWQGHDIPVPGDYDGVGHIQQAVYRPSTGQWFVLEPNGSTKTLATFGWTGHDLPVNAPIDSLLQLGIIGGIHTSSLTSTLPLSQSAAASASSTFTSAADLTTASLQASVKNRAPSGPLASTWQVVGGRPRVIQAKTPSTILPISTVSRD